MGRKKRSTPNNISNGGDQAGNAPTATKKAKPETGESYLVKKYRAEKSYAAMEAFVRYTKAHRMLDASYVRWSTGVTPEKPFVFSTRVGGVDLGWGRGKTREAAMDCACRAAFALVNAHGYKNFPIDDDCLMEAPVDLPPPPPPPPLPPGVPPPPYAAAGLPPPPVGAPPLPPGAPPLPPPPLPAVMPAADLIPQPQLQTQAPVATSLSALSKDDPAVSTNLVSSEQQSKQPPAVSLSLEDVSKPAAVPQSSSSSSSKLKGGLTLVFDPGMEDECMEERRASLSRYQKMMRRSTST